MDPSFISLLSKSFPLLIKGTWVTVKVFCLSSLFSLSLGLVFGVLCTEKLKVPGLSFAVEILTFILRAVPFFVQLLIIYFVFPELLGINFGVFFSSVVALGLCSSGYVCQIVRTGINSIPEAQWEATFTLGYSTIRTLVSVIFPQMVRNVLPAFNNELEALLKSTAILSSIGLLELTRIGMNIVSREAAEPLGIYLTIALIYVVLSISLSLSLRMVEKKFFQRMRV